QPAIIAEDNRRDLQRPRFLLLVIQSGDLSFGIDFVHIDETVFCAKRHAFAVRTEGDALNSLTFVELLGGVVARHLVYPGSFRGGHSHLSQRYLASLAIKCERTDRIAADDPHLAPLGVEDSRTAPTD